jgi:autotransporter-associated beta strand protein
LFDISSGTPVLVASSTSKDQNTENLWTPLVGGRRYRLEVSRAGTQAPFDWDYGLAWSTIGTIGWHGGGPWNTSSPSWTKGTFSASYLPGEHVVFSDWGLDGHVVIDGTVAPGSVLVENQAVPYTFSGGAITGATGLIKRGAGQLTLANANSYAGETLIQQGTLAIATDGALGLTSKPTVVSEKAGLVFSDSVNYTRPEPLSIMGHGPSGQGAIENVGGVSSFAGPVSVASDSTAGIADGELKLTGNVEIATGMRLYKTGTGILSLSGGLTWGPASAISADAGLLRLEPAAGSAVSVSKVSPTLLILGGAVRVDATDVDPLTDSQDPTVHADVINDAINGFVVEAGSVAVEQLIGAGTTHVGDGAELIVSQIEQTDLSIAPGGTVRLRPGGGTSVLTSLNLDFGIGLTLAGDSLAPPPDLFIKPPDPTGSGLLLASSAASVNSSAVSAVPEPGTLGLTAAALVSILVVVLRRRPIV